MSGKTKCSEKSLVDLRMVPEVHYHVLPRFLSDKLSQKVHVRFVPPYFCRVSVLVPLAGTLQRMRGRLKVKCLRTAAVPGSRASSHWHWEQEHAPRNYDR